VSFLQILTGDCRDILPTLEAQSVQCCVTSPPYWGLRDYGTAQWEGGDAECEHVESYARRDSGRCSDDPRAGVNPSPVVTPLYYHDECHCGARRIDSQLGLEATPEEYIANMVAVFREVGRVLRDDGTCWINLGSSYASSNTRPSQFPLSSHGPAYGTDDKVQSDYPLLDFAYPDLCDGCRAVLSRRKSGSVQQALPTPLCGETTSHDSEHQDFGLIIGPREEPCVQVSTINGSSQQPPAGCCHCANCGACLSVLRSSSRDASLCARRSVYKNDITLIKQPWVDRTSGMELSSLAHLYSAITDYKSKDLVNMPFWLAEALRLDGWYLRSEIVWAKPNPMPESVTDRPTKAHEMIYLLAKQERYFYDAQAIREPASYPLDDRKSRSNTGNKCFQSPLFARINPGRQAYALRNKRSVWTVPTQPYSQAHFATFPEEIPKLCILAGSKPGDTVLDPFAGSGTVGQVALELGRRAVLIELNPAYVQLAHERTFVTPGFL
jgi:DNA modification methylase